MEEESTTKDPFSSSTEDPFTWYPEPGEDHGGHDHGHDHATTTSLDPDRNVFQKVFTTTKRRISTTDYWWRSSGQIGRLRYAPFILQSAASLTVDSAFPATNTTNRSTIEPWRLALFPSFIRNVEDSLAVGMGMT